MSSHLSAELDSERWGAKIRTLRLERDWSQRDLADELGVHAQTVSDVERGRDRLTLERLNRILEALGYEASVELEPLEDDTRADWGAITPSDPSVRRRIRVGRELAEALTERLFEEFDVDRVYCIGSLAEHGGADFTSTSDVDLLVEGLEPAARFRAESTLELDVVDASEAYDDVTFDLVRADEVDIDPRERLRDDRAVRIPKE